MALAVGAGPLAGSGFAGTLEPAGAGRFKLLYQFAGDRTGWQPNRGMALIAGGGVLYGATISGGPTRSNDRTCGVAYRITTEGAYSVVKEFDENTCTSAITAVNGVTFYGVSRTNVTGLGSKSYGRVFSLMSGATSVLHQFMGHDGATPLVGPTVGPDGTLYGTTYAGGVNAGVGVAFSVSPGGTYRKLYEFTPTTGRQPLSEVVFGKDGALYGTTSYGGVDGNGVIYRLTTAGRYTDVHDFSDTFLSVGQLAVAADGTIYGTSERGGAYGNGAVWSLTPVPNHPSQFTYGKIYEFADGSKQPVAVILDGATGALYGAAQGGGPRGGGTLFRLLPPANSGTPWTFKLLYAFGTGPNGSVPGEHLTFDRGFLYGIALSGGSTRGACGSSGGCGTVWSYQVP